MGQALYRKYRSKSLSEIVGQEHITETLAKAIKSGRISHAYLFTGPRGVGKTSIARILAHEINGLPYDEQQAHIDIIEIDAASNRRIDEIRELRDKIHVAPAAAKYKVYIIDEVHMLTREAFNALLKTLEEPPEHAIFILATTEAHKLPETIVSRTQRYVFRPIEPSKAVQHLKKIAKDENINITDDALELIVEHGDGSFRDSISLLDQLGNLKRTIELADVRQILGIAPAEAIDALLQTVQSDAANNGVYAQLTELFNQGYQPANIAKQLATALRKQLLGSSQTTIDAFDLLSGLLEVPLSHDPEAHLEIALLRQRAAANPRTETAPEAIKQTAPTAKPLVEPVQQARAKHAAETPTPVPTPDGEPETVEVVEAVAALEPLDEAVETTTKSNTSGQFDPEQWQQVLDILKRQYNTLYGIVRMAQPDFSTPGNLHLIFGFSFHQKRANEAKNRRIIGDAVMEVTGNTLEITCTYDSDAKVAKPVLPDGPAAKPAAAGSLSTISNIFGGVEMVE